MKHSRFVFAAAFVIVSILFTSATSVHECSERSVASASHHCASVGPMPPGEHAGEIAPPASYCFIRSLGEENLPSGAGIGDDFPGMPETESSILPDSQVHGHLILASGRASPFVYPPPLSSTKLTC